MRHFTVSVLLFLTVLASLLADNRSSANDVGSGASNPPNIVFLLSDDQAWTDYGFMGHPTIQTPNLDALAKRSLVFERGYVTAPLCRPSLASMATGLYPFEHGITGNDADGKKNRAQLDIRFRQRFHSHPTFISELTKAGYQAHQSGKWWEGSWQDGHFTDGMTHGDPAKGGRHGDAGLTIGRKGMQPVTDFIDRAVEQEKPFLIWYAPFLPHTPHNPPERLLSKYAKPGVELDVAKYYAMCEWFDETCGELLNHIDQKGLRENTLVVYICDNGWAALSTNADDPNQAAWNQYAQRSKSSPYENGIRTPIMVSWPGKVEPKRSGELAQSIDLFPTMTAAAGIARTNNLPGINLLDTDAVEKRKIVFGVCNSTHNMDYDDPDATLQYLWCVTDQWKLLVRHHGLDSTHYAALHQWDTADFHLYQIQTDPHERNDVAAEYPNVVKRLAAAIERWHPTANSTPVAQ